MWSSGEELYNVRHLRIRTCFTAVKSVVMLHQPSQMAILRAALRATVGAAQEAFLATAWPMSMGEGKTWVQGNLVVVTG